MSEVRRITKENIDFYLRELAKEYKKVGGKAIPAEVILVGGASILVNYGFRDMTTDIDAIVFASSAMREAANHIADQYDLPSDWFNSNFRKTGSYSPKLILHSRYYKMFANILTVRTVAAEYLIAMKLCSGRRYKHDMSDIIGIIQGERENGNIMDFSKIDIAVCELYGSWEPVSEQNMAELKEILQSKDYERMYKEYSEEESEARNTIIEFEKNYPKVMTRDNVNQILEKLNKIRKNL